MKLMLKYNINTEEL